jgi:hypothetical protein
LILLGSIPLCSFPRKRQLKRSKKTATKAAPLKKAPNGKKMTSQWIKPHPNGTTTDKSNLSIAAFFFQGLLKKKHVPFSRIASGAG